MTGRIAFAAAVLAVLAPSPRAERALLGVDDVVALESAGEFDISPDGRWIVWVKTTANPKKNDRRGNIYLTDAREGVTIQLTRGDQSDGSPLFSPDGTRVAFRSARGEKAKQQIYVLHLRGGEAEKVTSVDTGVRDFDWLDDHTFVYSAREDSTLRERRLNKDKDDTVVVADQEHYPPVRLFTRDIKAKKTTRLSENAGVVLEFAVSPDGRWIVTRENQDVNYRYNHDHPPRQFLLEVATGERREICTRPHMDPYGFQWDAAGDGFYCAREVASDSTDTFVGISRLYYFDVDADSLRLVPLGWKNGLGRDFLVVSDGIVAALADGVADRIVHATVEGGRYRVRTIETDKPVRLGGARFDGRRVVYTTSDASSLPRVMTAIVRAGALEDATQVIELNAGLAQKRLSETAIVSWAGALGDTVEGILYYPAAYVDTVQYPLVALIHGGPTGVDPDFFTERWSNYPHVLAARGAFVLKVNYHGSGNYGLAWMESIKGRYYELEVPDIIAGIDYLVATGLVDETRVGVMGWSNGAILAIACCLESDRFKALCAGAGDVNWTSDYGNCAFGAAFDDSYFGGPPWENTEAYIAKSPLFRMEEMKTPTLIMFGGEDTSVPVSQGWEHFRAMQTIAAAPVRFLLFPGAGHGITKLSHQRRKMEEELAWLDEHLFGRSRRDEVVLDDASLLARELERAKVARVGHLVGIEMDAVLLPETVTHRGVEVGRFEVTRAQFAAFDPNYTYEAGTDNHPVTNVSLPLAQAYCLWLSQKRGRNFRLPTVAEMDTLLESAKANRSRENTLERWVGYAPTPDELRGLRAHIDALQQTRLLVEVVGSFAPAGENRVYDLGGNAAEWATDAGGQGVIKGPCAVTSIDERSPAVRPPLSYVGFRVVRD